MSKRGGTLAELMGEHGERIQQSGFELHDLPKVLGENMPKLEYHALGRIRLVSALRRRFGANYRSYPGVKEVLSKFDREAKIEFEHHMIRKKLGRKE